MWPSSIALAACILSRPELVRGKKVADIGCGLGLAGLAAAMAGAVRTGRGRQLGGSGAMPGAAATMACVIRVMLALC